MNDVVFVAVGGAVGAIARFWIVGVIQQRTRSVLPIGTMVVNVAGSLLLGLLVGLHLRYGLSDTATLAAGVGFCGAFTTFSTLMYETTRLAQTGAYRQAVRSLSLNFVLGGVAATVGLLATGAL